jgi:hypothetical protein
LIRGGRPPNGKHGAQRGKAKVANDDGNGRAGQSRRMSLGEVGGDASLSLRHQGRGQRGREGLLEMLGERGEEADM